MNKVYIDGNYFYLEIDGVDQPAVDFKNRVAILPLNSAKTKFRIISELIGSYDFDLVDLADVNGDPFTADSFESFYENNTGIDTDGDAFDRDAFGLQKVGTPGDRFDVEFIYNKQPDIVTEVAHGYAMGVHDPNAGDIQLSIGTTDSINSIAYYGYDVPYTPGNAQDIKMTGTLNEQNIADAEYFIVHRSSVPGMDPETLYPQNEWNVNNVPDRDFSTSQIFLMDFESLKVGTIRFGIQIGTKPMVVHMIDNNNLRANGYWRTPSLPPVWRMWNDATYTHMEIGYGDDDNFIGFKCRVPLNASATMRAICGTVKSMGGQKLFDLPGYPRYVDNESTPITVSTTLVPIISLKPRTLFNSVDFRGLLFPLGYGVHTNQPIRYVVLFKPTLTNANWQNVDDDDSAAQYDVSATAVSGGIVVDGDYLDAGKNADVNIDSSILGRALLKNSRNGVEDVVTIAAIKTDTTDADVSAHFDWREIR